MPEYRVAFPSWSQAAVFCPAHLQHHDFEQLANSSSNAVRCQVGKAYRMVLQESDNCFALLLAFTSSHKGEESPCEKLRRMSSPRTWDVALVPFPEDFAPLPTQAETGLACPVSWEFPPSLCILESKPTKFRVLATAEEGDTVTADHLLQMATLASEHKPTVLGIPGHVPIPYHLECTVVVLQPHALFRLLTTGSTLRIVLRRPPLPGLGTAARHDNWTYCLACLQPGACPQIRSIHSCRGRSLWGRQNAVSHLLACLVGPHYPSQNRSCAQREPCGSSHHETAHYL